MSLTVDRPNVTMGVSGARGESAADIARRVLGHPEYTDAEAIEAEIAAVGADAIQPYVDDAEAAEAGAVAAQTAAEAAQTAAEAAAAGVADVTELRDEVIVSASLDAEDGLVALVGQIPRANQWNPDDNIGRVSRGLLPGQIIHRPMVARIWLSRPATLNHFRAKLIARPSSDANAGDIDTPGLKEPGTGSHDVVLLTVSMAPDPLPGDSTLQARALDIDISAVDFSSCVGGVCGPDNIIFVDVAAYSDVGETTLIAMSVGNTNEPDAEPNWNYGWRETVPGVKGVTSLRVAAQILGGALGLPQAQAPDPVQVTATTSLQAAGDSAVLGDFVVRGADGDLYVEAGTVDLAALDGADLLAAAGALEDGNDFLLPVRFVSAGAVVVTDLDTDTVLTADVDYTLYRDMGSVFAESDHANVEVTYTAQQCRVDLIQANRISGALNVVEGTARDGDPQEWIPSPTSGQVPIALAYISERNIEIVETYHWRGFVRRGEEALFSRHHAWNRERLPATVKRLASGGPLAVAGYGDSVIAGGSVTSDDYYTANSTGHNLVAGYFGAGFPTDTLAAKLERYTTNAIGIIDPAVSGLVIDPAGAWHRNTWCWEFARQAQARTNAIVAFLNMGVGGTSSATGTTGGGAPHGQNATRLTALAACNDGAAPHLVFLSFGLNEIGSTATYANIRALIVAIRAMGCEVIVTTPTAISSWSRGEHRQNWAYTTRAIIEAAVAEDCAYIPFSWVCGYGNEGALGLSRQFMGAADRSHHPGIYEHRQLGRFAASLIL